MQKHERFEDLCSVAAVGQLSPDEYKELSAHLASCSSCRASLRDMAVITDSWIPAATPLGQRLADGLRPVSSVLREKFLAGARARGINLTRQSEKKPRLASQWPFHVAKPYATAAALAACLVTVAVLLIRADHGNFNRTSEMQTLRARIEDLLRENATLKERVGGDESRASAQQQPYATKALELERLRQEHDAALAKVSALEHSTALLSGGREDLEQQLAEARTELARVSESYAAVSRDLASTRSDLDFARAMNLEDRTLLAAQQKKIEELAQRPIVENAARDRERGLLAADRDIRELMGARNLHIIDVHDRDSKGRARRSFGRVFYTEGKSLIFYAFDLSDAKWKNVSFQAWGNKEDGSKQSVSLGLFYMDDQSQSRWVLRFNNPAVLSEIDSVFVTVEPPGGRRKPTGERLLYAFLNFDANHP